MKQFLQILAISLFLTFGLFACMASAPREETKIVQATVINKEYVEDYTDYGYYYDWWKGKFRWKFKSFPEEYNITVQYNDIVETFDRQDLYEKVDIGDSIDVKLVTYIDSDGEISVQFICLIN